MTNSTKLYETHSHTPLCKHALGDPEEYALAAQRRGLAGLTVTCHNPMPDGFSSRVRMGVDEFEIYLELVDRARRAMAGEIDVLLGIEADYFPGYESWLERQIHSADFHYVIGSVHPQIPEFRERFHHGDDFRFQQTYFRMLADAAETGLFDCISHPDLVKNHTLPNWDRGRIMPDVQRALDRIQAAGVAMEINTSGANKTIPEMNPFPAMLREMCLREIPIVIGADAHEPERVGDRFLQALHLARQAGYESIQYFVRREPQVVAIADAEAQLRRTVGD